MHNANMHNKRAHQLLIDEQGCNTSSVAEGPVICVTTSACRLQRRLIRHAVPVNALNDGRVWNAYAAEAGWVRLR